MAYRTFLGYWTGMAQAMGLEDDPQFIPHICRHTCLSRLADALMPAQQIQLWAGHEDITTTMRYVHASAASLVGGAASLDALNSLNALDNVAVLPNVAVATATNRHK